MAEKKPLSQLLMEYTRGLEAVRDGILQDREKLVRLGEILEDQRRQGADGLSRLPLVREFLEERGLTHLDELDAKQKEDLNTELTLLKEAVEKGKTEIELH